jgi:hypothetical protein
LRKKNEIAYLCALLKMTYFLIGNSFPLAIMKKLSILAIAAMMFAGVMSCEKKAGENGNGVDSTGAAASAAAGEAGANGTASAEPVSNMPVTSVEFVEENHNFGEIPEGDKVNHTFKFKNTGSNPLKVENVKPSCGCTTPDWSREEIPAGGEGFVNVEFDSKGKTGVQKKSVTVTFVNTDPKNKMLQFSGEVVAK